MTVSEALAALDLKRADFDEARASALEDAFGTYTVAFARMAFFLEEMIKAIDRARFDEVSEPFERERVDLARAALAGERENVAAAMRKRQAVHDRFHTSPRRDDAGT